MTPPFLKSRHVEVDNRNLPSLCPNPTILDSLRRLSSPQNPQKLVPPPTPASPCIGILSCLVLYLFIGYPNKLKKKTMPQTAKPPEIAKPKA